MTTTDTMLVYNDSTHSLNRHYYQEVPYIFRQELPCHWLAGVVGITAFASFISPSDRRRAASSGGHRIASLEALLS